MLDKALMHLMACNVCVKHLQNDVVGRETHAHDLKGINGGKPTSTLLYFTLLYFTGYLS